MTKQPVNQLIVNIDYWLDLKSTCVNNLHFWREAKSVMKKNERRKERLNEQTNETND